MTDICSLTLTALTGALQNKELSAVEAATACLERIAATEPRLAALLTVDREGALATATALDKEGPDPSRPLWGVPMTIKDALSTKGLRTTAGSRILENYVPFYDAAAVERLRAAGAVILGKANLDEFAMGSSTENSAYQTTRNPWNTDKVPGGSSGGSAASVSAGQCFASLGTDTGGSIRQPAALCGCVGLKPTYGRVSRYGLIAYGSSLDQIGPLARTVEDCARVLDVIAGHDQRDATSAPRPAEDYAAALQSRPLKGACLGLPKEFYGQGLDPEVRAACETALRTAEAQGATLVDVSLPHTDAAIATYYIIAMAEASSNLARFDGVRYGRRAAPINNLEELYVRSRSQGFGQEVKRRIMLGAYVLSSGYYDAYYRKAAQVRRCIRDDYLAALEQCDVLLAPVSPVTAWNLGSHSGDPLQMYLMDAYTLSLNLAGLPGLSLPVGLGAASRMPVGVQLIGKAFAESELLALGHSLTQALPPLGTPAL
ncbi:Asp-tRNA(Asn)/Glu-tRNA(Gln) amidotransferase subunit GatA [Desulfovibrio legallii]|mgnify:FL=1|uniref:Asp-tRNA(Asn)/Glu-tRNA(Gln) amidotransferase subunit GatA n=1 Tax=Desulfovibrio legallii TaxID=571438 RepID=UPI000E51A16F|nr:Asp-tRNA(Asn)/Glu-tRNA(Gln) amidotransferase subunit GatA [Desulfovibrio legallii]RHH23467.1 Asp-tRNA(Asn)/Glu-tRNA(Gln) amidotransferase subunit GatA [Desulfovibrio sp. AM18-2]